MEINNVAIVGLGLMGGSLAKALRRVKIIKEIIGIDSNAETIEAALSEGIIDKASPNIDQLLADSDVVFVCTPLNSIINSIGKLLKVIKKDCTVTDIGSVKSEVISYIEKMSDEFDFIGGHPMCGTEKSGYIASRAHLFENAYYVLTPCRKTSRDTTIKMEKILIEIGAIPVIIDSRKHDYVIGAISHVPHVISAALVNLIKDIDYSEEYMKKLAAGGFKDITRISSSQPSMWQSISLSNRESILKILNVFSQKINKIINELQNNEEEQVLKFFSDAKEYRDGFFSDKQGGLAPFHDFWVDILDRPGEIARVASFLSDANINIKNINIINNREDEAGCMKITLPDFESVDKACKLLNSNGYRVYKD